MSYKGVNEKNKYCTNITKERTNIVTFPATVLVVNVGMLSLWAASDLCQSSKTDVYCHYAQ